LRQSLVMIGLSVAVGRFVEALFWAILRVAGVVTVAVVAVAAAALLAWIVARKLWARQQRRRKP
jgi:NADH:ubiquinone oxidoreductase subunit H